MRLRLRERGPAGYFNSFPLERRRWTGSSPSARWSSRARRASPPATRSGTPPGWRDYAVVKAGEPALGGVGTLRGSTSMRAGRRVPRPGRRHGPDSVRRPGRRRAAARGRRRLGLGGRRRRRQPRGADRQAARPPRHRQRRARTTRSATCSTSSASTPRSTTTTGPVDRSARGGARRDRRLLRQRRRRPPPGRADRAAPAGAGWRCAARCRSTRARSRARPANLFQIVANNLTVRGFRASAYLHRMHEVARHPTCAQNHRLT